MLDLNITDVAPDNSIKGLSLGFGTSQLHQHCHLGI